MSDFVLDDERTAIREMARTFADDKIAPHAIEWDAWLRDTSAAGRFRIAAYPRTMSHDASGSSTGCEWGRARGVSASHQAGRSGTRVCVAQLADWCEFSASDRFDRFASRQ
jgi:hypothetical protein